MENNACPQGSSAYIWNQGDTLMAVARLQGVPEQSIRQANPGMNFAAIAPGTRVCIPQRALSCVDGILYPLRAGDTIESVARDHGVSALMVMERNPYVDPAELQPGMLLCVPTGVAQEVPAEAQGTAEQPPEMEVSCAEGYTTGTVNYGDSYGDLLMRHDVSYQAFRLANPSLNPSQPLPGQRFCVPPSGARGLCGATGRSYVMNQGDTLSSLSEQLNIPAQTLLRLNANLAPSDFTPGRVICVG